MSASIKTILIIGGTSGIGESFARRFHNQGKRVIVTGRRQERLQNLSKELPGLETYVLDNQDLQALPGHVEALIKKYPDINTVWVNGGIQYGYSLKDPASSSDEKVIGEITTNVTAPMLFARHFIPHLLALGSEANFLITSSGLAYVPAGLYPIYCPTKAFVHHFLVGLRQQMKDTNVNVIEIAPPYVETDLDIGNRNTSMAPMPLKEYTDKTFEILDNSEAKDLKEVAVGFAAMGRDAWRGAIGGILEHLQLGG